MADEKATWHLVWFRHDNRREVCLCGDCYQRLPDGLIKSAEELRAPFKWDGEPAYCLGCGKEADD